MLKSLLFALSIVISLSFTFQNKDDFFTPPGTVPLNDSLFIDKFEISNFSYREYTEWNRINFGKESKEYKESLPDSSCWLKIAQSYEPYYSTYNWHPAFKDYPVVGISFKQAKSFCKWRSYQVNFFYMVKRGKVKISDYGKVKVEENFKYDLPSIAVWEAVAIMGPDHSKGKNKKILPPHIVRKDENNKDFEPVGPINTNYGNPNRLGVYNLFGNVAEMTDMEGLCKGGDWLHSSNEASLYFNCKYSEPQAFIGFRCICTKIK